MKKYIFMLPAILLAGGCLWNISDPAAERAAKISLKLHKPLPKKALTLSEALQRVPAGKQTDVRCAFAQLLCASGKEDNASLLKAEQARIDLNVLLGYLPEDTIEYNTIGALDCPAEIPAVEVFEKTALMIRKNADPLPLLRELRQLHLKAVYAFNSQCPCEYVKNCARLADLTGVEFKDLDNLAGYEKRFDDAMVRRKKELDLEK